MIRLCDDAKKEAKIENGLEDIARTGFRVQGLGFMVLGRRV